MKRLMIYTTVLTFAALAVFSAVAIAATEDIVLNKMNMGATSWSPDGKYIAFNTREEVGEECEVYVLELETGAVIDVTGHIPPIYTEAMEGYNLPDDYDQPKLLPKFSADSKEVYFYQENYFVSDDPDWHFSYLRKVNIETLEYETVLENAQFASLSKDNSLVHYSNGSHNAIYDFETGEVKLYDFSDRSVVPNTDPSCIGGYGSIHPDNSHFLTYLHALDHTAQFDELNDQWRIYAVDIASGEAQKVPLPDDRNYRSANYSPDGTKILVTTWDYYPEASQSRDLETGALTEEAFNTLNIYYYQEPESNYSSKFMPITSYKKYLRFREDYAIWHFSEAIGQGSGICLEDPAWGTPEVTCEKGLCIFDTLTGDMIEVDTADYYTAKGGSWSPDGNQVCYILRNEFDRVSALYIYDLVSGAHKPVIPAYTVSDPTAVETEAVPEAFAKMDNFPNPFNPTTTIEFDIPAAGFVELTVFNVMGQKIASLLAEEMAPGKHSVVWNGRDDSGVTVSSGIYISRLKMRERITARQMTLVK